MRTLLKTALTHPLGRKTPVHTLARIVRWQLISRFRGELREEWVNGTSLIVRHGETGATGNLYFGFDETEDMGFFAHLLRPGDTFIDAGANVGTYSVLAGSLGCNVHAFEPAAETAPRLKQNLAANGLQAYIHEVALGERIGTASFTKGLGCVNSLSETGEVVVPVTTLDSFSIQPTAIKMDLEGGEEGALRGAAMTIASQDLLAIEVETVSQESEAMLRAAGLVRRWYDPFTRQLSASPVGRPCNKLWIRNEDEVHRRVSGAAAVLFRGRRLL